MTACEMGEASACREVTYQLIRKDVDINFTLVGVRPSRSDRLSLPDPDPAHNREASDRPDEPIRSGAPACAE